MKFRTDFVTNSSSTSYISVVVEYMDGREIDLLNVDEEGGGAASSLDVEFSKRNKPIFASNLEELKKAYDVLYDGEAFEKWPIKNIFKVLEDNQIDFDIVKRLTVKSFVDYPGDYDEDEEVTMQIITFDPQKELVVCEKKACNSGDCDI